MSKKQLIAEDKEVIQNADSPSTRNFTVDDILGFIGYGPFQVFAFCLAGLTMMAYACNISLLAFIDIPVESKWNLSGIHYAIMPAITGLTNIIGGYAYGYISDHYGRLWPYLLPLLHCGVCGLASAFSPSFAVLVTLRAVASLSVTGLFSVAIATLVEFLPVRNRGKVIVLLKLAEAVGSCVCAGLAWWLIPTYRNGWRYLIIAASILVMFPAVFRLIFHVQSPRYLIARGRFEEARKVFSLMAHINGKNLNDFLPSGFDFEKLVVVESPANRNILQTAKHFRTMFRTPYLKTTILISIVYTLEGMSAYGSSLFLPNVLNKLNVNPYFTTFVGYLGQIPGVLLMSIIVEWRHVGRLNSLRLYTALTVAFFLLFAFIQNQVTIPVFTILIYFSMVPIYSLLNTYISECYSTSIRALALVYFSNLQALFETFIPFVSGYVSDVSIPWLYPVVWAGLFGFQFVVSLFMNFETRGIRLEDNVQV